MFFIFLSAPKFRLPKKNEIAREAGSRIFHKHSTGIPGTPTESPISLNEIENKLDTEDVELQKVLVESSHMFQESKLEIENRNIKQEL